MAPRALAATLDTLPSSSADAAGPGHDELRDLYRMLSNVRQLDRDAVAWQRQGLIPGYAPMLGQEAAQVGAGAAVDRSRDFVFPTYREMGVAYTFGVNMVEYMSTHKAIWHGGLYDSVATRFAPFQAVVGGSVLHAVGWAHGQTLNGASAGGLGVGLAFLGDGASSQGDVHEAMNFAAILKAPVIFFVQNNGWAISVPTEQQVAGGSVAARAAGYGMAAVRVDGNDVLAVLEATRRAVAHARAGLGPVVVEAMTYRRGPHSTSDDPGRYRTLDDEKIDGGEDPLSRFRAVLLARGVADEAFFAEADAQAQHQANDIRAGVVALTSRPGSEMFDFVFQESTPTLGAQARQWREESEHV
ncbi:thiamine pyrophosphate-dependent enzyme [Cryobacterium sp. PH31-O1]|uniref:thiamine pyrophosphate-dependent enzyme n=1 Tax=Cryobacterium sp. PH31-O1 TaxID=3046306 RepID=UPI0024BB3C2B|nr:thiamine pyrophosphate-dependent enzyme [Cryobacterium sp. PH31-O1]MDJ0339756.1 thiamine pyrophosphate-dependent enzyme [Cryobacterium sp. PH31-O1]